MAEFSFSDPVAMGSPLIGQERPSIDYTSWDYPSIMRFLTSLAQSHFGDRYNNFVNGDFGVVLQQYLASGLDMLSFKIDYSVNEMFYPTAVLDKNIRRHARRWSYRPGHPTASRYDFTVSVLAPYEVDVLVPPGHTISVGGTDGRILFIQMYLADENGNPIRNEPITLPAGVMSVSNVVGIEGKSTTSEAVGHNVPFQAIPLIEPNVLPSTIELEVDGTPWEHVDNLFLRGSEQIFRVDQDDRTGQWFIQVGDDIRGSMLPNGSQVIARYRTGGGQRGNVPSGFVDISETISVPGTGVQASVRLANRTRGYGGGETETADQIKSNLPQWIKSQGRLVHLDDYTLFASRFVSETSGRVAKARAYLRHAGCSANIINIYVIEFVGNNKPGAPSDKLVRDIRESMEDISDCVHYICVKPGSVVDADVRVHVVLPQAYANRKSQIEGLIRASVDSYFSLDLWNLGMPLTQSDLMRYLSTVVKSGLIDVRFDTYQGYNLEQDGTYKTRHWELVRPANIDVSIDFSNEIFAGRIS